jgi:hypothetical protein
MEKHEYVIEELKDFPEEYIEAWGLDPNFKDDEKQARLVYRNYSHIKVAMRVVHNHIDILNMLKYCYEQETETVIDPEVQIQFNFLTEKCNEMMKTDSVYKIITISKKTFASEHIRFQELDDFDNFYITGWKECALSMKKFIEETSTRCSANKVKKNIQEGFVLVNGLMWELEKATRNNIEYLRAHIREIESGK